MPNDKPCAGCAFTEGAAANLEPHNNLKGTLCVLGGVPFYCHAGIDWRNTPDQMTREELRASGLKICAGWKREVRALAATGYFRNGRAILRIFAIVGMESLREFLNPEDDDAKEEARRRLTDVIRAFGRHRAKLSKGVAAE